MIKLISTDIDGTLINSEGVLPAANREALRQASSMGVRVILNTGKSLKSIRELIEEMGIPDPICTMTGGLILEPTGNSHWNVLQETSIAPDIFGALAKVLAGRPLSVFYLTPNEVYLYHGRHDPVFVENEKELLRRNTVLDYQSIEVSPFIDRTGLESPVIKLNLYSDDAQELELAYNDLKQANIDGITIEHSSPGTFDIHPSACGKKPGLEYLCRRYQIDRSEVMALGDDESDLELICWAGMGAVMENGRPEVKAKAPRLSPSNDECGVAEMVNRYVLKG